MTERPPSHHISVNASLIIYMMFRIKDRLTSSVTIVQPRPIYSFQTILCPPAATVADTLTESEQTNIAKNSFQQNVWI